MTKKTKREVLEEFAKHGYCKHLSCTGCPYRLGNDSGCRLQAGCKLSQVGAIVLLRRFPESTSVTTDLDESRIFTCVNADKAKVGVKGYFAVNFSVLKTKVQEGKPSKLVRIFNEDCLNRFKSEDGCIYPLFYPVEELEDEEYK